MKLFRSSPLMRYEKSMKILKDRIFWFLFAFLFICFFKFSHFLFDHLVLSKLLSGDQNVNFLDRFQMDSDMLVRWRLQNNIDFGIFSFNQFMGPDGSYISQFGFFQWLITVPLAVMSLFGVLPDDFSFVAPINIGLSGNFLGIFFLYLIITSINAFVVSVCLRIIWKKFGHISFVFLLIGILQPWFLGLASSTYWVMGIKFLPVLVLFHFFQDELWNRRGKLYFVIALLLSFSSGYEFISVLFFDLIAVIYLKQANFSSSKSNLRVFGEPIIIFCGCFIFALMLHVIQLAVKFGSLSSACNAILVVFTKRTGLTDLAVPNIYTNSLVADPLMVVEKYTSMSVLFSPFKIPIISQLNVTSLIVLMFVLYLATLKFSEKSHLRRYIEAWFIFLLGPVSWFLLARPHSAYHTHLNYVLWFLPLIPFAFFIVSLLISRVSVLRFIYNRKLLVYFITIILMFLISLISTR